MTGASRRISSSAPTGLAATLLAAAPSSTMSAPTARRRACAVAAAGSRNRPPSEKESSVMLRMPTISGRAIGSPRADSFEHRADPLRLGKDVELFDADPHMRDPRVGKAGIADALGKALAEIDMARAGDLPNGGDHMLVIDDAAAVFAGKRRRRRRGQLDRDPYPLRPVALGAADADAAHQHQPADDHRVAIAFGHR